MELSKKKGKEKEEVLGLHLELRYLSHIVCNSLLNIFKKNNKPKGSNQIRNGGREGTSEAFGPSRAREGRRTRTKGA